MASATVPRHHRYRFDEYLAAAEQAALRLEFYDGEIYAMAGGSPEHASLAAAVIAELTGRLAGLPCTVYTSDLRLRVLATGLATYPDVSVVCGPLELDPEDPRGHTVTNPTLVCEVLSPSTEEYDRGEKFVHYAQIPSLRAYLLVPQGGPAPELRLRQGDGQWATSYPDDLSMAVRQLPV